MYCMGVRLIRIKNQLVVISIVYTISWRCWFRRSSLWYFDADVHTICRWPHTSWDRILCLRECKKITPKVVALCNEINPKVCLGATTDHTLNFALALSVFWVPVSSECWYFFLPRKKKRCVNFSFSLIFSFSSRSSMIPSPKPTVGQQ